ncbi:MAG: hypothetical protein HY664_07490 [Chloroflexi bacterium]|nr:hypothetical protein [Chloroflexota bacterium]
MEGFSQFTQIISDIALGASAIIVAVVGFKGLRSWRAQLKGNAEYEVARRLIRSALAVRDTIYNYRGFLTYSGESIDRKRSTSEAEPEAIVLDEEFAHRNRLIEVQRARSDLHQAALEAEALWGKPVNKALGPLVACMSEIFATHSSYFDSRLNQAKGRYVNVEYLKTCSLIIYSRGPEDDYSKRLDKAIETIETEFRKYLK